MSSKTYPAIGLDTVRITVEDLCGVPAWGDAAQCVSDGFVSVAITANYTDIAEKRGTNGRGKTCARRPASATFDDLTGVVTFCGMQPEVYSRMTGAPMVVSAQTGEVIGFDDDVSVDLLQVRFGLEGWADAYDVADCGDDDAVPFWYHVWPSFYGGRAGDYTLEDALVNFTVTDLHTAGGAGWGIGPYLVTRDADGDPSALVDALTKNKHGRRFVTTVPPPEVTDGFVPLDDPDTADATGATAGSPGTWDGVRPFDFAAASATGAYSATPSTAWTTGQYVVLGDGTYAHWAGSTTKWVAGKAS
jgi:hypothetical protein